MYNKICPQCHEDKADPVCKHCGYGRVKTGQTKTEPQPKHELVKLPNGELHLQEIKPTPAQGSVSDTPETDAASIDIDSITRFGNDDCEFVLVGIARTLERERDAWKHVAQLQSLLVNKFPRPQVKEEGSVEDYLDCQIDEAMKSYQQLTQKDKKV